MGRPGALPERPSLAVQANYCLQCTSCVAQCPSTSCASPLNIRMLLRRIQLGTAEEVLGDPGLWACALCLECSEYCPRGINIYDIVLPLRQMAVARGLLPRPLAYFVNNALRRGRPFPVSAASITAWTEGLHLPRRGPRVFFAGLYPYMAAVEVLFRAGLSLSAERLNLASTLLILLQKLRLDGLALRWAPGREDAGNGEPYRQALVGSVRTLQRLGLEVAYLYEEEPWCGIELHTYGLLKPFARHARGVYTRLKELGIREIITSDTLTAVAFKRIYPRFIEDFDITVRHLIEVLAERRGEKWGDGRLKGTTVVFSDPCYVARHLRLLEEPRHILQSIGGVKLREAENNRLNTRCVCGGGMEVANPKLVMEMAKRRAQELVDTEAQTIVTSCPVCVMMLRLAVAELGAGAEVVDIGELVGRALGGDGASGGRPPASQGWRR